MTFMVLWWCVLLFKESARSLVITPGPTTTTPTTEKKTRRDLLALVLIGSTNTVLAEEEPVMESTSSGLRYQDFKVGTGSTPRQGQRVTIDYVLQTTGARYGSKIDSTKDRNEPFSFTLGDDDVIKGLQEAVATMKGGGLRRIYVPQSLGYTSQAKELQRPIPPGFAEYQRWKNIYANPNRPYQPDLVIDVKLFKFKAD